MLQQIYQPLQILLLHLRAQLKVHVFINVVSMNDVLCETFAFIIADQTLFHQLGKRGSDTSRLPTGPKGNISPYQH